MPVEAIWKSISTRYDTLSPQLRKAAHYVREHPQDVALNSLRGLAARAGVSPTSMTRLMQALGHDSFDAFQDAHRSWLTRSIDAPFSARAGALIDEARAPGGEDALLTAFAEAERRNLEHALDPSRRRELGRAADLIAAAPVVAVAGVRSCFPTAFGLHYALSMFMPRALLMTGTGGALLDELYKVGAGDALVVVTVKPYSRIVVAAARHAVERGSRLIAITDAPLSPIARIAEIVLVAGNGGPGHIASPIGPTAVAQALALLVLARAGPSALSAIEAREAMLRATSAYDDNGEVPA